MPQTLDDHLRRLPTPSAAWALFLDVDGTLIEIADRPSDVHVSGHILHLLERLKAGLGGALALVSGRPLDELDRLFAPLTMAAAGQHGLERRDLAGAIHRAAVPGDALQRVKSAVGEVATHYPGILIEDKGLSVAVHFRQSPRAEGAIREVLDGISAATEDRFHVQSGKMVLELKPAGMDKGTVVEQFLQEAPFAARTPVFLGDDVTDEDGFRAAQQRGGLGIRIGSMEGTEAVHTLPTVAAALGWLETVADVLDGSSSSGMA